MIVSSKFTVGTAQSDGRAYVIEVHTFDDQTELVIEYGPINNKVDYAAIASARAQAIGAELTTEKQQLAARAAAAAKLGVVLDAAVTDGKLSLEDIKSAGVVLNTAVDKAAVIADNAEALG